MGTSFSTPTGQIGLGSAGQIGDPINTFNVGQSIGTTGFISNNSVTSGFFTNADMGTILQTKYYNVFFSDTLLCNYPPGVNKVTNYIIGVAGNTDINNWLAMFNSIYCNLNTLNQFLVNMTTIAGVRTTNNFTTASPVYASGATPYPPYTYSWSLLSTYNNFSTPINSNTIILNPTSASCKFSQAVGTGYTNQQAQCRITDFRGWIGYSRPVYLHFFS